MQKNAVVTLTIGPFNEIARLTHPTLKAYADKIGAEFIVIQERAISKTTPHWEKFQIHHLLNHYRRIIYIDTDIIVREDCPNLFDIVPEGELGMFNEGPVTERRGAMQLASQEYQVPLDDWDNTYYNSGVMVISRNHKDLFRKPDEEISNFYEQSYLNLAIHKSRTKMFALDYKYNRMTCMDKVTGEHRLASYIVHYAGCPGQAALIEIASKDLGRWGKKEFAHKRNILIKVGGGIGDEISAEPVIRHLVKNIYPNDNVNVMTWFPRIFKHLPVKIHKMGRFDAEPDTPYHVMDTLAPHNHPSWAFMTVGLMQPIDYISVFLCKRTLPDAEKQVSLLVEEADLDEVRSLVPVDLEKLVVIHPGRGWASKTFPAEWYDKIVDALLEQGRSVGIIGQWMNEDQGTVDVNTKKNGVYDLRNMLTLGGMFALLSRACVLISNDSSPVHAAGAFDNHIILIPTCKHPDHVLPVRHGDRYYKATALYKKLTCDTLDTSPTMWGADARMDGVLGSIYDYIPDPEDIVKEALARSRDNYL